MNIAIPTALATAAARSPAAHGLVFGVTSTGIYCRPGCPARKPKQENIRFFDNAAEARAAGFRACKRCRPDEPAGDPRIAAVRRVCALIDRHAETGEEGPPALVDLARAAGLSRHHLQRTFTALMGLSPRAYADARRLQRLKRGLRDGGGVADAGYAAGFGSSSRVYERAAAQLGMTPASYAKGGKGASLRYATASCSLGLLFVAATGKGIAALYLGDSERALLEDLRAEFPAAEIAADRTGLRAWLAAIVAHLDGMAPPPDLAFDVRATAFQWRVWQALRAIPSGETRTYSELAAAIGAPNAQRAVGHACATNPVSVLVPCHRALRADGGLGGYRWGLVRKRRLLDAEAAAVSRTK
jgi:AraC family transcriptional regulator of adaptative response/methylated-DNA-[protein]-cysteine methyltransferase